MEVYQWLMRRNGFNVSDTGYFVYCNGKSDLAAFDGKLEFDIKVIPYTGNGSWVESTMMAATDCLMSDHLPASGVNCDYCHYAKARGQVEK